MDSPADSKAGISAAAEATLRHGKRERDDSCNDGVSNSTARAASLRPDRLDLPLRAHLDDNGPERRVRGALSSRRILVMYGLKRSGNHAVLNWLLGCQTFFVLDNIEPIAPILSGARYGPVERRPLAYWMLRHRSFDWMSLVGKPRDVLVTVEDHELDYRPVSVASLPATRIVLLRDPANMLASRIRKASATRNPAYVNADGTPAIARAVRLWKQYARECVDNAGPTEPTVMVYFNAWFQSMEYRRQSAHALGVTFSDEGSKRVSGHGGGSSFDGATFDDRAQDMSVLSRVPELRPEERQVLDAAIADEELLHLADLVEDRVAQEIERWRR